MSDPQTALKRLAEIMLEQIYAHEYGKSEKVFYKHTEELKKIIAEMPDEE